jgi:hypothetical protein
MVDSQKKMAYMSLSLRLLSWLVEHVHIDGVVVVKAPDLPGRWDRLRNLTGHGWKRSFSGFRLLAEHLF